MTTTTHNVEGILKLAGYTDEQIAHMNEHERNACVEGYARELLSTHESKIVIPAPYKPPSTYVKVKTFIGADNNVSHAVRHAEIRTNEFLGTLSREDVISTQTHIHVDGHISSFYITVTYVSSESQED